MIAKLKKAWPFAITCVIAAAAAVLIIEIVGDHGDSGNSGKFVARIPPVEFLYLDGARILDFLSELEGGQVGAVHRISKEISSINAGGSGGGFTIGASSQHESEAESTVTRNESSGLGVLLADLEEDDWHGVSYHAVELTGPASLKTIREGMLVRFVTHDLLSPGYIRPYLVVRQSATLAALFPQAAGNPVGAERAAEQRQRAESFARQVGPDPRITFAVSPPSPGGARPLKVLMPMRYSDLTTERSLLEKGRDQYTGGRLVVIGKVVRVFRHETVIPCGSRGGHCAADERPEYTDYATREIWRSPLEQASNNLIEHVSHSCKTRRTEVEENDNPSREGLVEGRACFLAKLKRQTELYAPGAVILPLAVYK